MRVSTIAALALVLSLTAAGCGGGKQDTIRVGYYGDCYGPFGATEGTAGAELAFIRLGAQALGPDPTDGVSPVTIAGKRVELVNGCMFYGSQVSELAAARRLVEQEHVDVLVTPGYAPDITEQLYPARRPGETFVSAGILPAPPRPNLFKVAPSLRQGVAGLGTYAYRTLGWRTAAIVGEDDPVGWTLASGFVAEFCSLGGKVVDRLWEQPNATSWAPSVRKIPADVDGTALMSNFLLPASFFAAYRKAHPDLARHVVMSGIPIARGDRTPGIMAAGFLPFVSTLPSWTRYLRDFKAAFPSYKGPAGYAGDVYSYDSVELALQAIAYVHGDISRDQKNLKDAMHRVSVETPTGRLGIDPSGGVVAQNFLIRNERRAGKVVPATVGDVPAVDNGFGGYFSAPSPPDSETQPACHKGDVPSWAR
jgi:branched-chain amino acid transport system substrate-binding protein